MSWYVTIHVGRLRWTRTINGDEAGARRYAVQWAAVGVWDKQTFYPPHRITHVKIRRAG